MAGERTEAPTPEPREEGRKRAPTARSQALTTATVPPVGLYSIRLIAAGDQGRSSARPAGNILAVGAPGSSAAPSAGPNVRGVPVGILLPLRGMLAPAAAASVRPGGYTSAPGLLTHTRERPNLTAGTKRIASTPRLLQLCRTPARLASVVLPTVSVTPGRLEERPGLGGSEPLPSTCPRLRLTWDPLLKSALGILDRLEKRRRVLNSVRVTR